MTNLTQIINYIPNINTLHTENAKYQEKPRLYKARKIFLEQLYDYELDLNELIDYYLKWLNLNEYVVIKKVEYGNNIYNEKFIALKCSKRGNDVYNYRVNKKFQFLYDALENYEPDDVYILRTRIFFITLTYKERDLKKWFECEEDFNRFMSRLRKIFKRAKTLVRTNEAQNDGMIHIHVLIDLGKEIEIIKHIDNDGKISFRIKNYELLQMIKNCWKYGFSDIQGFVKIREGLKYIFKYIKKAIENNENSVLTLSLNWLFRKRSFSINYRWLRFFFNIRLDMLKHNSNLEIKEIKIEFILVGIFSAKELGINNKWYKEFIKLPKKVRELL